MIMCFKHSSLPRRAFLRDPPGMPSSEHPMNNGETLRVRHHSKHAHSLGGQSGRGEPRYPQDVSSEDIISSTLADFMRLHATRHRS